MAAEKRQITRNRISLSCQTCRRRKVKCSKSRPVCESCEKTGEACVWGDSDKANIGLPTQQLVADRLDLRKRRAAELEDSDKSEHHGAPSSVIKAIEQKLNSLNTLMRDLNRLTPVSISSSPGSHQDLDGGRTSRHDSGHDSFIAAYDLEQTARDEDLEEPWMHVLSKLDHLNSLLKLNVQTRPVPNKILTEDTTQQRAIGHIEQTFSRLWRTTEESPQAMDIFGTELAPSEDDSNVLFRSWLWSTYPLLPLIPPHLVLRKYNEFFDWYRGGMDRGEPNPDTFFMPFLVSIWYLGHRALSEKAKQRWFPWAKKFHLKGLHSKFVHQLDMLKTEGTQSIWALAASVTAQSLALEGQDTMTSSLRNTINVRVAQSFGMHHERTLKGIDKHDVETRRRLWWEIVAQDTSLSAVAGTPPMIDDCYTDTVVASELKGSYLGTEDATKYQTHLQENEVEPDRPDDPVDTQSSSLVSVYHLVAKAKHQLALAVKRVIKANMKAQRLTMDELKDVRKMVIETACEIDRVINRIPTRGVPELDFNPQTIGKTIDFDHLDSMSALVTEQEISYFLRESSDREDMNVPSMQHRTTIAAFHKWARIMLSLMKDQLNCITYAPFLKNSKSRLWAVSRNCAMRSCHGFMRKFISLAEDPELRNFRWLWPTGFHPIHATIILLVDLHDRPHSDEAPRSRAMIDRMFSLAARETADEESENSCSIAVPLKEGGEEAWQMLRKLRHKAWNKAGLDPDVLWSEEDQIAVGVGKPLNQNDLFIRSLREDIIFSHKQRHNMADINAKNSSNLYGSYLRDPQAKDAMKQRFHPSELGPGEAISGPVTRGVIDLDQVEVPPILLLRARHDQTLMPFPLGQSGSCTHIDDANVNTLTDNSVKQNTEETEIFHIGELIKKIRQSQPQAKSANIQPVAMPAIDSGPWNTPIPDDMSCNFRNFDNSRTTTYQQSSETSDTVPKSAFDISPLQNQPFPSSNLPISTCGAHSSTVPLQFTQEPRQITVVQEATPSNFLQFENGVNIHDGDMIADVGTTNDMDFDWDRWDELFGHFGGFEDMMVDVTNDEHAVVYH
ncbi:hypothetical protein LTR64_008194 [Lithohypha guttulata]|uniref:uncharacterized protein n=1 Tax=Lithohypha guttulata TaxID=1690604 RepID=UPI002DE19567|nr:hypothetical protein LTR51_008346 [Lithohypha guttulata]